MQSIEAQLLCVTNSTNSIISDTAECHKAL